MVLVFQPRTLTTLHLGSVAIVTLLSRSSPHLFFYRFLDHSFPPLSYLLPIRSRSSLKPSQFCPLLTFSTCAKSRPPGRQRRLHPPPVSLRCLSLHPALRACVWFFSHVGLFPLCLPRPAPGSLSAPGG